ncbi:MAG TPA: hypothetical protein VK809_08945 [Bacteroidia bacterium]|jgi:hypothetical protein|nr:hypothetical protein [Bacteroidia bacterium]
MKKLSILVAVAGLCVATLNTQAQGLYLGVGGGYNFASGVQSYMPSPSSTSNNGTASSTSYTSQSYSLGSGGNAGIYVGYMFSKNLGAQLGISDKFASTNSSTVTTTSAGFGTETDVWTLSDGMLMFTPALKLMTSGDGKLQVYTVTGLIIGIPSTANYEDKGTASFTGGSGTSDEVWQISGGTTMGFHGALGVVFMVSDKIGIFGEIDANLQNWAPSKQLITTGTETETSGGVTTTNNYLSTYLTSQKETDFVSSFSTSSTTVTPNGSPTQSVKTYLPFSSFGINVGIHFNFGGSSN